VLIHECTGDAGRWKNQWEGQEERRGYWGSLIGSKCVYVCMCICTYICGDSITKPTEYILKRRGAKKVKNPKHHNMRMSL
jgi:hypothetical protein